MISFSALVTSAPFWVSAIYGTFIVSFVTTLLETDYGPGLWKHTFRRWRKFLLLLIILALIVGLLGLFQG